MAEIKVLSLAGLETYDEKVKKVINDGDAKALSDAKAYADGLATNYDAAGTAQTKVDELANGQVKTNKEAIEKLDGGVAVEGSVKKQIADAKAELEGKITASVYDDTEVKASIKANADAIQAHKDAVDAKVTTLIGDDASKSVRTIANEELAAQLLTGKADADFKTLKELAAWLEDHPEEVAAINASISDIQKLIGTLPVDATAKDVVNYIKEVVDAEKTRATGVESGLDTRLSAVETALGSEGSVDSKISTAKQEAIEAAATDAKTKADKAFEDAKTYADGLAPNYATAAQGAKADSAVQKADVVTGTLNGTISVQGTDVAVKGLASAAYAKATDFDASGTAETKVQALATGAVATNTADIAAVKGRLDTLEATTYTEISDEEIAALFA